MVTESDRQELVDAIQRLNAWTNEVWGPNMDAAYSKINKVLASGKYRGKWVCAVGKNGKSYGFIGNGKNFSSTVYNLQEKLERSPGRGNYALLTRWLTK
jgi:hypothetical protein